MGKRKIKKGGVITSLDQLARCEWVIVNDKSYHQGWAISWPLRMAKQYIDRECAFEGIRLTNGEYYEHLTDDKIKDRFGKDLHALCPWFTGENGLSYSPGAVCEGSYCCDALETWKDEQVK